MVWTVPVTDSSSPTWRAGPKGLPVYYAELEAALGCLMDATFEATDANEKARLAATEMRARLVLDRFRKAEVN